MITPEFEKWFLDTILDRLLQDATTMVQQDVSVSDAEGEIQSIHYVIFSRLPYFPTFAILIDSQDDTVNKKSENILSRLENKIQIFNWVMLTYRLEDLSDKIHQLNKLAELNTPITTTKPTCTNTEF